jgi:hypothetical protein
VRLVPVAEAADALTDNPDLLVVGGPTHVHGMSRESTRKAAIAEGAKPESGLTVEADAHGPGTRDLLESIKTEIERARAWGKDLARAQRERTVL